MNALLLLCSLLLAMPEIATLHGTTSVPLDGTPVTLPIPERGHISLTFQRLPKPVDIRYQVYTGGPALGHLPHMNIWGSLCPWPVLGFEVAFSDDLQDIAIPKIFVASKEATAGSPAFYYIEAFDTSVPAPTLIAQAQVFADPFWAPDTATFDLSSSRWSVIANHRYAFEIVSSSGRFLTCGGVYN